MPDSRDDTCAVMIDEWAKLIVLNRTLGEGANLADLDVAESIFEFGADAVEDEMFIAAANRLADRRGLEVLRIDVADRSPSFLMSLGCDLEDAKQRMRVFYQRRLDAEQQANTAA